MYTPSHVIDVATVPRQSADGLVGIKAPELLLHVVDEEASEGQGKTDFEKAIPANSGKERGVPMLIKPYPEHNCHHGGSNWLKTDQKLTCAPLRCAQSRL